MKRHQSSDTVLKTVEVIRRAALDPNLHNKGYGVTYICRVPTKHCGKFIGRFNIVKEWRPKNFKLYKVVHTCMKPGCPVTIDRSGKTE